METKALISHAQILIIAKVVSAKMMSAKMMSANKREQHEVCQRGDKL